MLIPNIECRLFNLKRFWFTKTNMVVKTKLGGACISWNCNFACISILSVRKNISKHKVQNEAQSYCIDPSKRTIFSRMLGWEITGNVRVYLPAQLSNPKYLFYLKKICWWKVNCSFLLLHNKCFHSSAQRPRSALSFNQNNETFSYSYPPLIIHDVSTEKHVSCWPEQRSVLMATVDLGITQRSHRAWLQHFNYLSFGSEHQETCWFNFCPNVGWKHSLHKLV